ncbi:hypothetical protein L4D76_04160 [Photobacterium sagamiensis]|uniref:hypothetical protein n=1 Tax=Photobacterium sagamiensis TaxID=2910241 RepID=UPI003D0C5F84
MSPQEKALSQAKSLLKDIAGELHFRSPHSSKLAEIQDMLKWLETGIPNGSYQPLYADPEEQKQQSDEPHVWKGGAVWISPLKCCLAQLDVVGQILLNLPKRHASELFYKTYYSEAGRPYFFILPKSRTEDVFEAFFILFAHYLRYGEEMSWLDIHTDNMNDIFGDILAPALAECNTRLAYDVEVMDETNWHTSVALSDILDHPDDQYVGIVHDKKKLGIDGEYLPPIHSWILNAMQLKRGTENPLYFYETKSEFVFFGS